MQEIRHADVRTMTDPHGTPTPESQASVSKIRRLLSEPSRKYTSASIQAAIGFSQHSNRWCNIFSRVTLLSSISAGPKPLLLDYGNDVYISETVSIPDTLKRIEDITAGVWRCGDHNIRIVEENFVDQVNLSPCKCINMRQRNIRSDWPAECYEAGAKNLQIFPESRYLSSAITIYPSMDDLIVDKFQVDLREHTTLRGIIQIFLPKLSGNDTLLSQRS